MLQFNEETMFLGTLCKRNHDYNETGKSPRYIRNAGSCVICKNEQRLQWKSSNKSRYNQLQSEWNSTHKEYFKQKKREQRSKQPFFYTALMNAKRNCCRKKIDFNIDEEHLEQIWNSQKGMCYWFNLPMDRSKPRYHPLKPSLDKLIPSLGYVKGNVVWATTFANSGRSNTSVEEFKMFIEQLKSTMTYVP